MLNNISINLNLYRHYNKQPLLLALIMFRSNNREYGGCFASYESMAADLGTTHNNIAKGVKTLIDDGMVEFIGWHNRCRIIRPTAKTLLLTICQREEESASVDDSATKIEPVRTVAQTAPSMENPARHMENLPRHMENLPKVVMENLPYISNSVKENKEKVSVCVYTPREEENRKEVPEVSRRTHTHNSFYPSRGFRKPNVPESMDKVIEYAREHGGTEAQARKFYMYYASTGWRNSRGVAISNWQMTLDFWVAQDKEKAEAKRVNERKIHCNGNGAYSTPFDRQPTQEELDEDAAFTAMWEAQYN